MNKKKLANFILAIIKLKPKAKNIDTNIFGANVYYVTCCLKIIQGFVILIKNIECQVEKKVKAKTNPKIVISWK